MSRHQWRKNTVALLQFTSEKWTPECQLKKGDCTEVQAIYFDNIQDI